MTYALWITPFFYFFLLFLIHTSTHSHTVTSNILVTTLNMQPIITVSCVAPKAGESIIVRETMYEYYDCYWICTLTNQPPQLRLSLMSVTNTSIYNILIRPKNIRSLRIVSRDGTLVHNAWFDGIPKKVSQKSRLVCCFKSRTEDQDRQKKCLD